MSKDALDHVIDCYVDYASFVNAFRSIPDSRDGLKLVQRRLLSTLLLKEGPIGNEISCPSIIGSTIKYYHPHSEQAIYGALVTLVNDPTPIVTGHGNFGRRTLNITLGPAAPRYTKVKLNELGIRYYGDLIKFAPIYINENEFEEPKVIPNPLPYALISGSLGIGVGLGTAVTDLLLTPCLLMAQLNPYSIVRLQI